MRRVWFLSLFPVLACGTVRHEWRELFVPPMPFDLVWDACLDSARTEFRIDVGKIDRGQAKFTTRWRNDLQAFGKARRRRACFEIVPADKAAESPDRFVVRYCVERQKYTDMSSPLEPTEDSWKGDGQDAEIELRLRHHLRIRLAQAAGQRLEGVEGVRIEDPMRRR